MPNLRWVIPPPWSISNATLGLIHLPVRLLGFYAVAVEITSDDTDASNKLRYQCIGAIEREKLGLVSSGSSTLVVTRTRNHVRLVIGSLPMAFHSVAPQTSVIRGQRRVIL